MLFVHGNPVLDLITPSCKAVNACNILKVDPGGYSADRGLGYKGLPGSVINFE